MLVLMDAHCMIIPPLFKNEPYICFYPDFQHRPSILLTFLLGSGCVGGCWVGLSLGNALRHISILPSSRTDLLCSMSTSPACLTACINQTGRWVQIKLGQEFHYIFFTSRYFD